MVQLSHPYMTTEKNKALTRWTFVGKVMSLYFNMLSRFVITFLPRSKLLFNFMAAITIDSNVGSQENKVCHSFHCFPIYLPWSDAMNLVFECWVLSQIFHSALSVSSSGSLVSLCFLVSSAYLQSLIFLPAILIPACASSIPEFHMMYSAEKLNKLGDNIQPWCTPFPIWNQSIVPCLVLTLAFWLAYRFLRREVRWPGIPISWRIFHSLL